MLIRIGPTLDRLAEMLKSLSGLFAEAGFARIEARHLFAAEQLIDLYGEDVRTRAYLLNDPLQGAELCLRPDFTVPIALAHGEGGWGRRAAYSYAGPVFRRQEAGSGRPIEYLQAGIESFGEADRDTADARILTLILRGLDALEAPPAAIRTGDLNIVFALLDALDMPPHRRAALRRHVWRPNRFKALIGEFLAPASKLSPLRRALIEAVEHDNVAETVTAHAEVLGLRTLDEIATRAGALRAAAAEPPMPAEQGALIAAVLGVEGPSGTALSRLRALTAEAGVDIGAALERFERRLDALNREGFDAEELPFSAAFGRALEYYSGFVFEVVPEAPAPAASPSDPGPPFAGGGRYDAMTVRLGAERAVPAVGAMIRPEAVLAALGGRS